VKNESNIGAQPNTTHVKYTSAQPFTPRFVKDHLSRDTKTNATTTTTAKKLPSFRAQALYNERVHRRQLGLTRRIQSQRTKADKKKKKGVVKREKMGRREAAEMGMWRLRREEARYVPMLERNVAKYAMYAFFFSRWDAFVPLHRLWLGYMSELLGLTTVDTMGQKQEGGTIHAMKVAAAAIPSAAGMHAKLVKADFHGSIMTGWSFFFLSQSVFFC
jgi:ribonuclease P protein subunit POP4